MVTLCPNLCRQKTPTLREFNFLIECISDEDKIGHLFIVDIEFNEQKASEKHFLFNEIYTPIFEKKKVLTPIERSVFQLLGTSYKATSKNHSTIVKKFSIPLYAKHSFFNKKMWGDRYTNLFALYL